MCTREFSRSAKLSDGLGLHWNVFSANTTAWLVAFTLLFAAGVAIVYTKVKPIVEARV